MTKTTFRSIHALAWASVLTVVFCAGVIHAQTTLDLNSNPSFDFGNDPPTDPLFAPETLGLTNGIDLVSMPDPPPTTPPVWNYQLLPGSQLEDECLICGRPTIIAPMRGDFRLRLLQENPLFSTYAVDNLAFTAGTASGPHYKVFGQGLYQVGGEVGVFQEMSLDVYVDDGTTNKLCTFTNATIGVTRPWPFLEITLRQTHGTDFQTFTLKIEAAPVREIWFSTKHGFHPGVQPPYTNYVSPGDLVSTTGRIIKRNQELTARLGMMPSPDPPDLGLDAVDVLPGGEIAFSIEHDVFSEALGPLHHGDLLSNRGRVVARNQDLIRAFMIMPPVPDVGLDAVQVLDSGEILFSIESEIFSGTAGQLRRGDLLSNRGVVVRTHDALLARFHPPPIPHDWGLDAIYVWPSGELWFSLEEGFTDDVLGPIQPGDLLSDQGQIIYRNLALLDAFAPVEDLADFGLDALFVVNDATEPPPDAPEPRCSVSSFNASTGDVSLHWEGAGRTFQIEKVTNILGPWRPLSPIVTEPPVIDPGALRNAPQGFYRLRQW